MNDQMNPIVDATGQPVTSRRGVLRAAAWATPAVVVATSAPAFARSSTTGDNIDLKPHIDPVALQSQLDAAMTAGIATAAGFGFDLPSYEGQEGIPQCINVNFAKYNIYFSAQRNGVDADGETMTFTLSEGLEFVGPYTATHTATTSQVTITGGKATPPKFRAKQNTTENAGTVSASFAGRSEEVTLPISDYSAACAPSYLNSAINSAVDRL